MSLITNAELPLWNNYVDLQNDVKPYLQIASNDTTNDLMLQMITNAVCQYSQKFIGQPIGPTPFDRRFDGWSGWNGAYLELPYYPVLEITYVNEYWGTSGPHILSEQTPTNQVDGFQCDYLTGRLIRVFPGLVQKPWFPGSRNVEVSWIAGRNPIPDILKMAACSLVAYWWRNEFTALPGWSPAGGEFDVSTPSNGLWPGVPHRIESIFAMYCQIGLG